MNKQILKAFILLTIVGFASSAMATATINASTTIGSGNTFTPSAKVGISITSGTLSYAAGSCHVNGTKEYGTVGGTGLTGTYSDTSKIYIKDIPTQTSGSTSCVPTSQNSATQLQGTWN